jgi:hypothetical protein
MAKSPAHYRPLVDDHHQLTNVKNIPKKTPSNSPLEIIDGAVQQNLTNPNPKR